MIFKPSQLFNRSSRSSETNAKIFISNPSFQLTGVGLLVSDVMPIYMNIALDIIITMRFSINCSTVIYLPTVCFLSREKPIVKTMPPGSIFYHIIFRSAKSKTQKYLATIYLLLLLFHTFILYFISITIKSHPCK